MPKLHTAASAIPARSGRSRRIATSLAEINVVPLVDGMLVLLIIFMLTAPLVQRGVDVDLPVARGANQMDGQPVYVTVPLDYRQSNQVFLGDERIRVDALQERIRQKMDPLREKQVFLRGDS